MNEREEGLLLAFRKKHDKLAHIQNKRGLLQMTDRSAEPTKSPKPEQSQSPSIAGRAQEKMRCARSLISSTQNATLDVYV